MKLTKEQKILVKNAKVSIEDLARQQDELYHKACDELNTKDEEGWLFDYCFNRNTMKNLEKNL